MTAPERYADAFHITGAQGVACSERSLGHDPPDDRPCTRDLYGVVIPPGVREVKVQAREFRHGYGGKTLDVMLPGR